MIDWQAAELRFGGALKKVCRSLLAMTGIAGPAGPTFDAPVMLPRQQWFSVNRILRTAESALRRLILVVAMGLKATGQDSMPARPEKPGKAVKPGRPPESRAGPVHTGAMAPAKAPRAFRLFDPRKTFDGPDKRRHIIPDWRAPRILFLDAPFRSMPTKPCFPVHGSLIPARSLVSRLMAMSRALEDIQCAARRLLRQQARRRADRAARRPVCPVRPGLPPAWRAKPGHEADLILRDCQFMALDALNRVPAPPASALLADTS